MPLRINGFGLIQLDTIMGPVICTSWVADDWSADEIEKFRDPAFTVKVFTAAKTGVLPRSMDFNSTRCVFIPVSPEEDYILVLYTNRSGQAREVDRLWRKACQLLADYRQDYDLQLLATRIKAWSAKQRSRGKQAKFRTIEQAADKGIESLI
ncbi:MAG: hypothetical protein ACFFD4_22325 [Candidatus Odinarchaeota archaeon]